MAGKLGLEFQSAIGGAELVGLLRLALEVGRLIEEAFQGNLYLFGGFPLQFIKAI